MNAKKETLSVVIITFNEEKKIKQCIDSIVDIADEIIVVDSFSTDHTEIICKQYPEIQFIKHPFEGYTKQKNYACSLATMSWILNLDADECLDFDSKKDIISYFSNANSIKSIDAFIFNRLNNYCGKWIKHGSWYPDKKIRLWRREIANWQGQNLHEKLVITKKKPTIQQVKGNILHYTIDFEFQHMEQIEKFTNISSNDLFSIGKNYSFFRPYLSGGVKFIKDYLIKLGFLDGKYGFRIARLSAYSTYLKYKKVRTLWRDKKI